MRGDKNLINIKNTDGIVRRVARIDAETLVGLGLWEFANNTEWRAFKKSEAEKSKKAEARKKAKAEKKTQEEKAAAFSEGIL